MASFAWDVVSSEGADTGPRKLSWLEESIFLMHKAAPTDFVMVRG
jgi:hypothetical protein